MFFLLEEMRTPEMSSPAIVNSNEMVEKGLTAGFDTSRLPFTTHDGV